MSTTLKTSSAWCTLPASNCCLSIYETGSNISDLVSWLGNSGSSASIQVEWRTNRLRLGIFELKQDGSAVVQFGSDAPFVLFGRNSFPEDEMDGLALLADRLAAHGTVLVLATSVAQAEKLAEAVARLRKDEYSDLSVDSERFDARVERELYSDSPLRSLFKKKVAFHHAQLPPRVRSALEKLIANREIDVVCATTTLAEGVNFPFSTVLVQSLVSKDFQLTPRALWNIAGRAGRFGVDAEGHCILFQPSRWSKRLKQFRLEDYFQSRLRDIPPVRSALATAIVELQNVVEDGKMKFRELEKINLTEVTGGSPQVRRRVSGLVNLLRVNYAHANATGAISTTDKDAPEFKDGLLASRQLSRQGQAFAVKLALQQRAVLRDALQQDDALVAIAARVGWSLETQSSIYAWLHGLESWRLGQFGYLVRGGNADVNRISYLIGPVSKLMSELEGQTLGGWTSFVAVRWIEGLPLSEIRSLQQRPPEFGSLVKSIYSRVQYLLPWALYGVNELIQLEASRRGLFVEDGVRGLSILSSEGVPSFDALQLVLDLDIERVDATRLAAAYNRSGRRTDLLSWFKTLRWETLVGIVRGADRRRLDPDLRSIWESIRASQS